jgi:hypothetical protein
VAAWRATALAIVVGLLVGEDREGQLIPPPGAIGSVWVDHLPRGRLGVVAGARLGPLVRGAGAGARGRVIGSFG